MADNKGSIQVSAIVDDSLKLAISTMGEQLQSVLQITNDLNRNSMNTKSGLDSLNKALAGGADSSSVYARATSNLAKNQQILSTYFKNAAASAKALENQLNGLNGASAGNIKLTKEQEAASRTYVATLNRQVAAQKSISQVALKQDYKAQAAALTNLSNKYSMAGTRIGMALTLPLVAFGRTAFSSFKNLQVETVRTTKLINDSYTAMKDVKNLGAEFNAKLSADGKSYTAVIDGQVQKVQTLEGALSDLGKGLDSITMKYGISRELVQGLAGDYAEIGINSTQALAGLVDLTAATEKLGNVDISESQNFIKSIYQTVMRVNRDIDPNKPLDYGQAIAQVTGQLAMFNLIENKTSLSLNNIAKGFPELTASATSFGLSMGEATALMVPMVAAGFQVGASANSVKISLQRLVNITKQNSTIIKELRSEFKGFHVEAGVGIKTIQNLADGYNVLKKTKGEQGTLEFFSRIFGTRQGPRMEVAIQNLAQFQQALDNQDTVENKLGQTFQKMIQNQAGKAGLAPQYSKFQIKKFEDLSKAVNLGQSSDQKVADVFKNSRAEFATYLKDEAAKGRDLIGQVKTESGRALLIAAAGGGKDSQAQAKFLQEVNASLNTAETRYNRAREIIKQIGRQVVPILGEILKVVTPILSFITRILDKIGPVGKMFIGIGLVFLAAIGPAMKILGAVFQLKAAFASIRSVSPFGRFRTQAIQINEDMVRSNELLFRMKGNLTQIGSKFYLQSTMKEFKQLEKAMKLQAGNEMQQGRAEKILRKLGVDQRASDFSGLMGSTQESIKQGFQGQGGDLSVLQGYRKEIFDDFGNIIPKLLTEAKAIGKGIAEEFIAILNAYGFDTSAVKAAPPGPKQTLGALAGQGKLGPPQGPTSPPSPSGPGSGPGSGPSGTSPGSSGTGKRVIRGSTNRQAIPMPVIEPPVIEPFNPSEWGIEQVYGSIGKTMEFLHKATRKQLVEFAKSMNISKISGLGISSSALQAGTLRKHLMSAVTASQQIVAKVEENIATAAETVKDVIQPNAPPQTVQINGVEEASNKATTIVAEAQVDKNKEAVTEQGVVDAKAVQQKPARQPRATKTEGASKAGTEVVQEAQEKADVVAVKEQVAADAKAVTLIGAPGTVTSSITGKAREYASTLDQMWLNSQISITKPFEEIIESLNLVKKAGTGSSGAFIFTKQKFLLLAETLGIDLPPIFNKMGELLSEEGGALAVTKKSLIELIQSMTKLVSAPDVFKELNGQMVLEFESELNRALMSGNNSRKRFNFPDISGRIRKAFSSAFTTETGSIFTDITKKMPSQTGLKSGEGAVDYTKIKLTDLGYRFRPSPGYQKGGMKGAIVKLNQKAKDILARSGSEIQEMINLYADGKEKIERELILSTKRTLNSMLSGVPSSRAKSALIRREMTSSANYAELISRQTTIPSISMDPRQLKKDAEQRKITVPDLIAENEAAAARREQMGITGPIDKMSEGQYEKFNKARMKGIAAARKRSAEIYDLMKTGDFESIEAAEKDFNEKLKEAAVGVDFAGSKRSFPKLKNFNVVNKIQDIMRMRISQLEKEFGSLAEIPRSVLKSGATAAVDRAGKDLAASIREEQNKLKKEIEEQEAVVDKIAFEIASARANAANARNITKNSEEGQALFGKGTKKAYIEKQEAIANDPKRAERLQLAIRELEIRQESVVTLNEQAQALREQLALEKQRLGIVGQTGDEYARTGEAVTTRRMRPVIPQIVSPLESKVGFGGSVTSQAQAEAEAKLKQAREALQLIEGSKIDFRMARNADTPDFIRSNAATRFKELGIKIGRVFAKIDDDEKKVFEAIDKRIAQAVIDVETAERNVNIAKASGGGGSAGGTSMRDSMMPMAGQRVRGPRMPDIGPKLMSITTGNIADGVGNIYGELQNALGIPNEIMQQVIQDLRNGYTNSAGEFRKAQTKVDEVGRMLTTEVTKDIAGVVEALRAVLGTADLTVENVRNALVEERQRITNFGKPSKTATTATEKSSAVDISIPKVTKGDTPEYKKYESERNALVAEIKAQIDELGTSEQQLLKIHADVLRPLARAYDVERGIVNSGNKGKIIKALLEKVTKSDAELMIAQEKVLNSVTTSIEQSTSEKKSEATRTRKPRKQAQPIISEVELSLESTEQVLMTAVVEQSKELEQVVQQAAGTVDTGPIVAAGEKVTASLDDIVWLIMEAVNLPIDDLLIIMQSLIDMPKGMRNKLSAATKQPFKVLFEHIENTIVDKIAEMNEDTARMVFSAVDSIPSPATVVARTVAESLTLIEQEISNSRSGRNGFGGIPAEIDTLLNEITTLTEDQLIELKRVIEQIAIDPTAVQNWSREIGSDIFVIYQTIADQIAKLKTSVQNTTPPVITATPQTGGGSGSGGAKPPTAITSGGIPVPYGQYGPPSPNLPPANYNVLTGQILPTSNALKNMGITLIQVAKFTYDTSKKLAIWLIPQLVDLGMAAINAVAKIIPFGRSILNLVSLPYTVASGIFKLASAMKNSYTSATTGLKGIDKFSAAMRSLGDQAISMLKNVGAKIIPGMSGNKGSGRGIGGMLTGQVGMGAGMLGMQSGMLGMMGGNMLQSLIQSLSAIPVIGTPVVIILSAIAGVIGIITKTSKTWKNTNKETFENFHKGWLEIKKIFGMLAAPFEDFIGTLIGGTSKAKSGTDKAKDALQSFSEWFLNASNKLKGFVEKTVVPALRKMLEVILIIFNNVKPVIGSLFSWISAKIDEKNKKNKIKIDIDTTNTTTNNATNKNVPQQVRNATAREDRNMGNQKQVDDATDASAKVQKTWTALKENLNKLTKTFGILVKGFLMSLLWNIMAWIDMAFINAVEQVVILVVNLFRLLAKSVVGIVGMLAKALVSLFFIAVKLIVNQVTLIPKAIAKALGFFSRWIPGFQAAANKINGVVDGIYGALDTAENAANNGINTAVNFVDSKFDKIANSINKKIGSWSNVIAKSNNQVQNKLKKETGAEIKALFEGVMPEGSGKGLMKSIGSLLKQAFANPANAKAAGQALQDGLAKIKDVKLKATLEFNNSALDAVSGALGTAINKIKDDLNKQLNDQKDASLKVFDDQVTAIEALAEAETQLTATESYETNRRRMIRDNELRRQNNRKDRSLAIYEGRIDDARSLDLQEIKDTQDFNSQVTDLDSGRQKELEAINRSSAIATIKAQHDAVAKEFDILIKGFDDYATKLLANGTFTKEQWDAQTLALMTRATTTSSSINTTFKDGFVALPGLISTNLNPVTAPAGFFAVGMQTLAGYASKSFGQTTGIADPTSILGVTRGVLGAIPIDANTAFAIGGPIQSAYGNGIDAVNTYVAAKTTGTGPETTSALFTQAITDAAAKMVAEAKNKSPEVAAAAAKLVTGINTELAKIQKDSLAKAIAEASGAAIAAMQKGIADAKKAGDDAAAAAAAKNQMQFEGKGTSDLGQFWSVDTVAANMSTFWYKTLAAGAKWIKATPTWLQDNMGKIANGTFKFAATTGAAPTFFKGGMMPYGEGGPTFGPMSMGIPATLHGGEFVIRKSAVDKYGLDMLNQVNKGIYAPKVPSLKIPMANYSKIANAGSSQQISTSESNHNYNFFVDNFIGETEWFNTMMKEYNVKVVPANQKQAGLESRVVKSYNGINRGM